MLCFFVVALFENQYVVAALYQFADLHYYKELREPLKTFLLEHDIKGSLLLASEGINGTVSGTRFSKFSSSNFKKNLKFVIPNT